MVCLLAARLLSIAMRNRTNSVVLALAPVDDSVGSPVIDRGTHRLTRTRLGIKKKPGVLVFLTYI